MTKDKFGPENLLNELLVIPNIEDRIRAVAEDIASRHDQYRCIDPFDLAEALGAPDPQDLCDWNRWTVARILPLQEASENRGYDSTEDIQFLYGKVSETRFSEIENEAKKAEARDFSYLLPDECHTLERLLAEYQLKSNLENGMGGIARCTVVAGEVMLSFEGDIEDDGTIIFLRTPYDERDGLFQDFNNCLTERE
jgi:hypothetical protein